MTVTMTARRHLGALVLAAGASAFVLAASRPAGTAALGITAGGLLALHAVALVVVWRSDRFLNLAQVGLAGFLGAFYSQLAARRQLLVWVHDACESCVPVPRGDAAAVLAKLPPEARALDLARLDDGQLAALAHRGWLVGASTLAAFVAVVAIGLLVSWAIHALVVRRLAGASRLAATAAAAGLGQALAAAAGWLPGLFGGGSVAARSPIPGSLSIGGVVLAGADVAKPLLAIAAAVAIGLVLRRGRIGLPLRAAAEAPDRAATLGVDVGRMAGRAWLIAGALAAAAGILEAVTRVSDVSGVAGMLPVLLATTVAGMTGVVTAAVAGLLVGALRQGVLASVTNPSIADLVVLLAVIVVLAVGVQRRRGRADRGVSVASGDTEELRAVPTSLRSLPEVVRARSWLLIGAVVLIGGGPLLLSPSQLNQASVAVAYAVVGLSLLIVVGWGGQLSLGQFAFAATGAWAAASTGLAFPFSLVLGAAAGAVASVLVAGPAARLGGQALVVASLAFAAAVPGVLLNPELLGGSLPRSLDRPQLLGIDLASERAWLTTSLVVLAGAVAATVGLRRSRTGRALLALRDDEAVAVAHGIDPARTRLAGAAAGGALAGVGGVLYSHTLFGVSPESFGVDVSVDLFLVAVAGGLGSVAGPVLGAVYLALLTFFSSSDIVRLAGTGLGAVAVVLLLPGGLARALVTVRDAWLARVAGRRGIVVESFGGQAATTVERAPIRPPADPTEPRYALAGQWQVDPS